MPVHHPNGFILDKETHVSRPKPTPEQVSHSDGNRAAVVKATARLIDKISDADVDLALKTLRDAMEGACLSVRAPRKNGESNNYEFIPDHPTRIAAARVMLDVKLKHDLTGPAQPGADDKAPTPEEVAEALRGMAPDLTMIVGVWTKAKGSVVSQSSKAARILKKVEAIDLADVPE